MERILNLGCGRKRIEGAVNLDITPDTQPDVVHDLNVLPWPFSADSFDEVHAYDVIEHLDNLPGAMIEISRICSTGAKVCITVPHFSSANAFTDPTHRHFFSFSSLDYFTQTHGLNFYSSARYEKIVARLFFYPSLANKIIWRLANRYPEKYERRWAWVFPAWYLYFELRVLK